MAPRAKRRKIQTPSLAHTSNSNSTTHHEDDCNLHGDADRLLTTCNALKGNGTRCGNKVKTKSTDASEYLPVCRKHGRQRDDFPRRRCIATAACGEPCLRVCPASDSLNHVCGTHTDVEFPCYIERLPTELWTMVIKNLVPRGPIKGIHKKYSMARTLLQVNKRFSTEVGTMLFYSKQQRLFINFSEGDVTVRNIRYSEDLETVRSFPLPRTGTIEHLGRLGLHQFKHIELSISLTATTMDHWLQRILEYMRHVLSTLKLTRKQGHEAEPPSKDERKSLFVVLTIKISGRHNMEDPISDEIFATINAIFEVLRLVDKTAVVKRSWAVKLVGGADVLFTPRTIRFRTGKNPNFQRIAPRLKMLTQSFLFTRYFRMPTSYAETADRSWSLFLKFRMLFKDLVAAGLFGAGGRLGGSHSTLLTQAREALSNRDEAALARLTDQVWAVWTDRKAALAKLDAILEKRYVTHLEHGMIDCYIEQTGIDTPVLSAHVDSREVVQGNSQQKVALADTTLTKSGVYRVAFQGTSPVYQLLTPRVVRDLYGQTKDGERGNGKAAVGESTRSATDDDSNDAAVKSHEDETLGLTQTKLMRQKGTGRLVWRKI